MHCRAAGRAVASQPEVQSWPFCVKVAFSPRACVGLDEWRGCASHPVSAGHGTSDPCDPNRKKPGKDNGWMDFKQTKKFSYCQYILLIQPF